MRHQLTRLFFLFLIIASSWKQAGVTPQRTILAVEEQQMALGNLSGATADPANHNNYLMMKPQYALSYSRERGGSNWVSWHVKKDWIGNAYRQNDFGLM